MKAERARRLTAKERLFIAEYLVCRNAAKAAIACGYSKTSAKQLGHEVLHKPHVAAELQKRLARLEQKLEVSAERLLREAARIAFSDPRKYFNADGTVKPIHQLDDDAAAALGAFEISTNSSGQTVFKFKPWDKNTAHNLLFRHKGMLTDPAIAKLGQTLEDLLTGTYDDEAKK